jgi:hypothetical protein
MTMKKRMQLILALNVFQLTAFAELNALIEVKVFKTWVIDGEVSFGNFVIKNTGTDPLPLAKNPAYFNMAQVLQFKSENAVFRESRYQGIERHGGGLFYLPPGETHIYEGQTFFIETLDGELHIKMSIYFGNDVWIDSEPVTFNRVVPDSVEQLATITDGVNPDQYELRIVTYKNERWLYTKLGKSCFSDFPLSLTNKIRVEPHDGRNQHKIWDGDKSMIYQIGTNLLLEGPDENNVFGKWTRERKQQAEAENAEVRRKKAL